MFRFDAQTGYFFYPDANGIDDAYLWLNKGSTYENNVASRENICIVKHGLKIPANTDCYDDFIAEMGESEKEFKKALLRV